MNRRLFPAALLVMAALTAQGVGAQEPARLFKEAMNIEVVDGDLKAAITKYEQVVKRGDRSLAARALLRIAGCYQKLGDAQARRVLQQIISEYSDQTETVTTARAELIRSDGAARRAEPFLRRVFAGTRATTILPDGRRVTYDADQNLVLVQANGTGRLLTRLDPALNEHSAGWLVSKDGTQLAYNWYTASANRYELRLLSLQGAGLPTSRRLFDNPEVNVIYAADWSPDGKSIAVNVQRKDRTTQVGLLDVETGSFRVLKSIGWAYRAAMSFSPDGRHLAWDLPGTEANSPRDVGLMPLDASRQTMVAESPTDDSVAGWSPDGSSILFVSDRRGSRDLWAVPFDGSRTTGPPAMVYGDLGQKEPAGVTKSGGLHLNAESTDNDIIVAAVDFTTGKVTGAPRKPATRFVGTNSQPDWSPDGRFLAYLSARTDGPVIVVQSVESWDVVREVRPEVRYANWLRWSPDGREFAVSGTDPKGRIGAFRVDAISGAATLVVTPRDDFWRGYRPIWSSDGKRIYYELPAGVTIERELASGVERQADERSAIHRRMEPPGEWVASVREYGTAVFVSSAKGGAERELLRVPQGENIAGVRVHPNGGQIAIWRRELRREVYVLENFLPRGVARK